MSEDTFERDLRLVLRELAPVDAPASLREAVAVVPRTHPAPRRAAQASNRQRLLAVAGLAAVIVVAAVGLALALGSRASTSVAGPSPSAATSAGWTKLTYGYTISVVDPSAAPSGHPIDVASARLKAARIPFSAEPSGTQFTVTVPSDRAAEAERLIGTTGKLDFVPMGNEPAAEGSTVDLAVHPALFGNGSVTSAAIGSDQTGQRTIDISLAPTARDVFATYTKDHVGEYVAIVLDGQVLTAPVIQSSIPNGHVQIQSGGVGGWDLAAATQLITLLESGAMPWPINELSSAPVAAPADLWTPAPTTSPSSMPSIAPSPSTTDLFAVADACLAVRNGPPLPDGYAAQPPLILDEKGAEGAALFVLPVSGDAAPSPSRVRLFGCRYERLTDGSIRVELTNETAVATTIAAPASIALGMQARGSSGDVVVFGQVSGSVKRLVGQVPGGSPVEAGSANGFWMAWNRASSELGPFVAYDQTGKQIWSDVWP